MSGQSAFFSAPDITDVILRLIGINEREVKSLSKNLKFLARRSGMGEFKPKNGCDTKAYSLFHQGQVGMQVGELNS